MTVGVFVRIDFKSGKPVYLQVVDQVRVAVASGQLRPGDALPSIRPLAEELRVNRNTVAKAYAELETQGVIETFPGKGSFVRETESPLSGKAKEELLLREIDEAVVMAHHLQIDSETFLRLARQRLDHFASISSGKTANK